MKKLIVGAMLVTSIVNASNNVILLSERVYDGEYNPDAANAVIREGLASPETRESWGIQVQTSTTAPSGPARINSWTRGTAAYYVRVTPAYYPFGCNITKQVCLNGQNSCVNQLQRYLINSGTLIDGNSFGSDFFYTQAGTVISSSTIFMGQCSGVWDDKTNYGAIRVG